MRKREERGGQREGECDEVGECVSNQIVNSCGGSRGSPVTDAVSRVLGGAVSLQLHSALRFQ